MNESAEKSESILQNKASRRDFLRPSAVGLSIPVAAGALAACSTGEADTAGMYTIGSGDSRRSSMMRSSTTPITEKRVGPAGAGR